MKSHPNWQSVNLTLREGIIIHCEMNSTTFRMTTGGAAPGSIVITLSGFLCIGRSWKYLSVNQAWGSFPAIYILLKVTCWCYSFHFLDNLFISVLKIAV